MKKIAIITGAAGGIGTAISEKLISALDGLVLIDIDANKLTSLENNIKALTSIPVMSFCCDVGNSELVNETVVATKNEMGIPTILINNAAIGGPFHKVNEVSDAEWYQIINTNLKSVFNFSKILLPMMKKISYGRFVNIASIQGYLGATLSSTYTVSKHGVIGYTRAIATEWGEHGITCNAICPGYVDTELGVQDNKRKNHAINIITKTPAGRIAKPMEIANLVAYLTRDEASFINGSILTIDGGLTCHTGV